MEFSEMEEHGTPMRIMLLVTCLQLGGAEQQVAALARKYVALGHAVSVVSLLPGCEVDLPLGIEVLMLNVRKTPLSMVRALMRVRRFVRRWQPDVIHAHMVHANLFARVLTRMCHVPVTICTSHSVFEGGRLRMLAYRLTERWSTLTTHVSQEGRQCMIDARAATAQRIIVVPNGIDMARYRPSAAARAITRAALGIPPGDRLVINVGRLVWEKAQGDLIDAFGMATADIGAVLMIAGDGPLRPALAHRIEAQGLHRRAVLLGVRHDIPSLLNAADLFVLSSQIEGMPMVLGEALACGCPVVATDASGVASLMGDAGMLVPRGNVSALALAMRIALARGRGDLADEAARYQHVASGFSIERIAHEWLRLYAEHARGAEAEVPPAPVHHEESA